MIEQKHIARLRMITSDIIGHAEDSINGAFLSQVVLNHHDLAAIEAAADFVAVIRKELTHIFWRLRESQEFEEGFVCGMIGVEDPQCRHEAGSTEWEEFYEGVEVGARTKVFLDGE